MENKESTIHFRTLARMFYLLESISVRRKIQLDRKSIPRLGIGIGTIQE